MNVSGAAAVAEWPIGDHPMKSSRTSLVAIFAATVSALGFALVSAVLLFLNGSLTLAVLEAMVVQRPDWGGNKGALQFALFTVPLLLLIAEWIVWDRFRSMFGRKSEKTI